MPYSPVIADGQASKIFSISEQFGITRAGFNSQAIDPINDKPLIHLPNTAEGALGFWHHYDVVDSYRASFYFRSDHAIGLSPRAFARLRAREARGSKVVAKRL